MALVIPLEVEASPVPVPLQVSTPIQPGGDKFFAFTQSSPASTWTITHNLHKFPSVSIVDTAGTEFIGSVKYIDENTVTVSFNADMAGKAYLN